MQRSLSDWLQWQSSLNPREIELGLERVRLVFERLAPGRPGVAVITVGGSNGKGSTVRFIEALCAENGLSTAVYTSPHLVRYNERMRINSRDVDDAWLVRQFETVERARQEIPLTYFEFGTLAALAGFGESGVDLWILEVGLGGRLDAVNVVDPDVSLITTVSLEHQDWLGDTIDQIAAEKAGILRKDRPAFYGDELLPDGLLEAASRTGARLSCFGKDFGYSLADEQSWDWFGSGLTLNHLPRPTVQDPAQLRNFSLGLSAVAAIDQQWLKPAAVNRALQWPLPAGRFQLIEAQDRRWVVDVAHNPQAAEVLHDRLAALGADRPMRAVIGMLADKQVDEFVRRLLPLVDGWIVCPVDAERGLDAAALAARIERAGGRRIEQAASPQLAMALAHESTRPGDRILVTGSFHMAGPALSWLGLY